MEESKVDKRSGHAIVIPWPGQGHINPLMHFSRWLQTHAGMFITFVNTQYNHDRLINSWHQRAHQQLKHKLGKEKERDREKKKGRMRLVAIPDGLPQDMPRTVYNICVVGVANRMGPYFEALLQNLLRQEQEEERQEGEEHEEEEENYPPVTCIISDLFMSFVPDLAIKYGIPRIGFWTQSASAYACQLAVTRGFVVPPETQNSRCKDIVGIPGVLPMRFDDFPTALRAFDMNDFMFNACVIAFTRLHETSCILINSSIELEPECLRHLYVEDTHIFAVGPTLPREYFDHPSVKTTIGSIGTSLWEEDASCLAWLDSHPIGSVLYISFGSIIVLTMEQMEEFALGLEASGIPLLWVMRPDLILGKSSLLPKGFAERMGDKLQFVSWAPQLEVLSHSSIGGFLTHCGWNSTMESIVKRVPMLCWPGFADQPLDRRLIVDLWQVGLEFVAKEDGVVTREEVEVKVKALMRDEEGKHLRNRINKLGEATRLSSREENGSSNMEFHKFLKVINGLRRTCQADIVAP